MAAASGSGGAGGSILHGGARDLVALAETGASRAVLAGAYAALPFDERADLNRAFAELVRGRRVVPSASYPSRFKSAPRDEGLALAVESMPDAPRAQLGRACYDGGLAVRGAHPDIRAAEAAWAEVEAARERGAENAEVTEAMRAHNRLLKARPDIYDGFDELAGFQGGEDPIKARRLRLAGAGEAGRRQAPRRIVPTLVSGGAGGAGESKDDTPIHEAARELLRKANEGGYPPLVDDGDVKALPEADLLVLTQCYVDLLQDTPLDLGPRDPEVARMTRGLKYHEDEIGRALCKLAPKGSPQYTILHRAFRRVTDHPLAAVRRARALRAHGFGDRGAEYKLDCRLRDIHDTPDTAGDATHEACRGAAADPGYVAAAARAVVDAVAHGATDAQIDDAMRDMPFEERVCLVRALHNVAEGSERRRVFNADLQNKVGELTRAQRVGVAKGVVRESGRAHTLESRSRAMDDIQRRRDALFAEPFYSQQEHANLQVEEALAAAARVRPYDGSDGLGGFIHGGEGK